MSRARGRAAAVALAGAFCALALVLAACGDDEQAPIEPIDDPGAGAAPSAELGKQEFIDRADPLCAEANAAIANLSAGTTASELGAVAAQERSITRGVLTQLRELGPPADDALTRFLDALAEQVDVLEQRQAAAAGDDLAAYEALSTELSAAKSEAAAAASEYGFEDCGGEGVAVTPTPDDGSVPAPAPAPAPTPAPPPSGGAGGGGGGGSGSGGGSGGIAP